MQTVIETRNLTKRFGDFTAVSGTSLHVGKGEIYGFLGLNGAGKTTMIRMILGMIRPSEGSAHLFGEPIGPDSRAVWARVGALVEIPYAYPNLTVQENLEMVRQLRGIADKSATDRIIGLLGLRPYTNRVAKKLSLGNAQRLGLAKALLHRPELLILDEPTNGLDPAGILEIRELLRSLAAEEGVTIFVSSHILGEIARFASRIGIIHEGELLQELSVGELDRLRRKRLMLRAPEAEKALQALRNAGYEPAPSEDGCFVLKAENAIAHPERIAKLLAEANCPPSLLQVGEEDLESYFLRTIRGEGGAA